MSNKIRQLKYGALETVLTRDTIRRLEDQGIPVGLASPSPTKSAIVLEDFSPVIKTAALKMQNAYVSFFCLENAVRELIAQRLIENHGADWWIKKVPQRIKDKVSELKKKEEKLKYHANRSGADIGYTTFGHLVQIVIANWDDFSDLFPDQHWLQSRFNDLETSRNILMHTNVLPDIEMDRIQSIVRDWLRQVG